MVSSVRGLVQNINRALSLASERSGRAAHRGSEYIQTLGILSASAPSKSEAGDELETTAITLFLAFVAGSYFLATLLLLRMSVPAEYRAAIAQGVGNVPVEFFHRLFDMIFLLAFCFGAVVLMFHAAAQSNRIVSAMAEGRERERQQLSVASVV
jgi:hypothetical protein